MLPTIEEFLALCGGRTRGGGLSQQEPLSGGGRKTALIELRNPHWLEFASE
jgi:hypothetical protein